MILLIKRWLVIMYLTTIASGIHLPQVHEDLNEKSPEYKRSTRQLAERKHIQSMFNYLQPDRLKAKYHHQQQADFRNLKSFSSNPISKSNFNEDDHDWKPFQPNYESPVKSKLETFSSKKLKSNYRKPKYVLMRKFNDSDVAGSEDNTETVKSDHQDPNNPLVYVTSDLLMNNFGLDNKATEQVLQNSATNDKSNPEQLQFEQILENHVELEGLHKILLDSKRTPESQEPTGVRIEHNGSPQIPLESLQQQLDAVNKAQAEQVLTAAQKQAESHVKAQHEAIALAQKKAEEEVLAKIAAHNQGVSLINVEHLPTPQNTIEHSPPTSQQLQEQDVEVPFKNNAPEVSALQGRPLDQVIVNPIKGYSGYYASAAQDLRNAKPRVQGGYAYRPVTLARPHEENVQLPYFSALPPLFNPKKVQIYSPVSPYTPHFEPSPTKHTLLIPEIIKPTDPTINTIHEAHYETNQNQDVVFTTPTSVKNLYAEEPLNDGVHQQYAAKYAFGYRILDEKHGNDFGHEEERDGKLTKGQYYVRLPDGRKQNVHYYADNSGYHAKISYENIASHPYVPNLEVEQPSQLENIHT
ncbi:hypothetical protein ABEB36_007500 [Hypothenemus hampei]|uniref:Uncharacterized protein n=1 Tax=Hypothenemus hampei TaxID=57062 RepID=A0ABD1EV55_HYPHA